MPWLALPVELIVRILEDLDPQALLTCRNTSRLLKSVIDETAALQYHIALHSSGMVDGPPGLLSTSERLSLLRSYETSWKNVDWNTQTSLPVPNGSLWELNGNVWAHSRGVDSIDFVQIPSRLRGIPLRQWTLKLDSPIRDFSMDPSLDLLVTIRRATIITSHRCQIRLLTLSTGGEHRLARDATLEHDVTLPRLRWSYLIRISGDYVGILFINAGVDDDGDDDDDDDDDGNELVVWNWKTCVKELMVTSTGMVSFVFLGNNFVLASTSTSPPLDHDQPSLLLFSLDQRPVRSTETRDTHLLRFLFPTGRTTHGHSAICLTSDPSPSWSTSPTLQVPFQIPRGERTIAFSRLYRGFSPGETSLMLASTLLGHINGSNKGEEGRDIQWKSWGPGSVAPLQPRWTVYTCFVFGMRYILPKAVLRDDTHVIVVRDLCPRRFLRASEEEREESNALHQAMGSKEPYPRSIVKCVNLPRSISPSADLMISEDGILALEYDRVAGKQRIHLLTF